MIYVTFLLAGFTISLAFISQLFMTKQVRPDAHLFFQIRPGDTRPFEPSRALPPVKAWVRRTFYEVFYDEKGRPAFYHVWENGKKTATVYLMHNREGKLVRKVTQERGGGTRIREYRVD